MFVLIVLERSTNREIFLMISHCLTIFHWILFTGEQNEFLHSPSEWLCDDKQIFSARSLLLSELCLHGWSASLTSSVKLQSLYYTKPKKLLLPWASSTPEKKRFGSCSSSSCEKLYTCVTVRTSLWIRCKSTCWTAADSQLSPSTGNVSISSLGLPESSSLWGKPSLRNESQRGFTFIRFTEADCFCFSLKEKMLWHFNALSFQTLFLLTAEMFL